MSASRGLVMVNTGTGKGKTTAALGAALRAAGHGWSVFIVQFVKNQETGEIPALAHVPGIEIKQMGLGRIHCRSDLDSHRQKAREAWAETLEQAQSGQWNLMILDEICVALHHGLIDTGEVLGFLKNRPSSLNIIMTGRNCPDELLAAADTVTYMDEIKHHFRSGLKARAGIEH
jgi:cob(I)alamin adenosyltransferase